MLETRTGLSVSRGDPAADL